ncbi:hypothetical protein GCM10009733_046600 [Nonomuraea maheshkhaliensis]|uniref:Uncharacterized protein n=1 Tax=Nonomuraea maheshkhaliensis TaxID=419590 RepID=A0ABP4RHJ3_9ACTN
MGRAILTTKHETHGQDGQAAGGKGIERGEAFPDDRPGAGMEVDAGGDHGGRLAERGVTSPAS